jgi:hypothetical protein
MYGKGLDGLRTGRGWDEAPRCAVRDWPGRWDRFYVFASLYISIMSSRYDIALTLGEGFLEEKLLAY